MCDNRCLRPLMLRVRCAARLCLARGVGRAPLARAQTPHSRRPLALLRRASAGWPVVGRTARLHRAVSEAEGAQGSAHRLHLPLTYTHAGPLSPGLRADELPKNFDHAATEERLYTWRVSCPRLALLLLTRSAGGSSRATSSPRATASLLSSPCRRPT